MVTTADLVRNMSYEVMPFNDTERNVVENVPRTVPLSVTVTAARGVDATLDLAGRLTGHGYLVTPHLAARQFSGRTHLADAIARLDAAGVRSVFVIGGDAPQPAGPFTDALGLLQAMEDIGHPFQQVGIGGYPEGHGSIPQDAIDLALKQKAPLATQLVTQICFDPQTTGRWAAGLATAGVGLPVFAGVPGPVTRQKLIRISAGIGLGQSARFLQKQQNLFWRLLLPGAYNPTRLVQGLGAAGNTLAGLHIFTFNELGRTERWRQRLLRSATADDRP